MSRGKIKKTVQSKDEPVVQQLIEGGFVKEAHDTKIYDVLEAVGTGLKIRYTEKTASVAIDNYEKNVRKNAKKAANYRKEWILNRLKAKDYKDDDKTLLKALNALARSFWNYEENKIPKDFIVHRIEEIEFIEIQTYKYYLRLRLKAWEAKLSKWAGQLHPLKPKDASKRADKARAARGKIEAWLQEQVRIYKNEIATPKEQEAYSKVLKDHVFKRLDEVHRAWGGNQSSLEV